MPDSPAHEGPARWRGLAAAGAVTPLLRWAVLVHAVPFDQPWRATCPGCDAPARPAAGAGPLWPAGRCHHCGRRVGAPPYAVEVAAGIAAGLVAVAVVAPGRSGWEAAAFGIWAAPAVALAFIDVAVHRLPFRLTIPAALAAVAALGLAALAGADGNWPRALLAGAGCAVAFALVTLVLGDRAFGLGDSALALGAGTLLGWLGWGALVAGLFLAFLSSGLVAMGLLVARRATRRDTMPFGPYLVAGTLLTLAWAGL